MKSVLMLSYVIIGAFSAFAVYPMRGFYYITGVDNQTFDFSRADSDRVFGSSTPVGTYGIDICTGSEAAFARYSEARGGSLYPYRAIAKQVDSLQFNRVVDCIETSLKNADGNYCWLKSEIAEGIVYPSAFSDRACSFLSNCGFAFYNSYMDASGMDSSANLVAQGESITRIKAKRVFNALFYMKKCVREPSVWYYGSYYDFTKVVDGINTPTEAEESSPVSPFYSGRIAYYNRSKISASWPFEGSRRCTARWHVKQNTHEAHFCDYRGGASKEWMKQVNGFYNVYRIFRKKINWSTGSEEITTSYVMQKQQNYDIEELLGIASVSDDVACPEITDSLLNLIAPTRGSSNAFEDYLIVECISSFALDTMGHRSYTDGFFYWDANWQIR